jgi:hypothetical protein
MSTPTEVVRASRRYGSLGSEPADAFALDDVRRISPFHHLEHGIENVKGKVLGPEDGDSCRRAAPLVPPVR